MEANARAELDACPQCDNGSDDCRCERWTCEDCGKEVFPWNHEPVASFHDKCPFCGDLPAGIDMVNAVCCLGDVNPIDHGGGWVWPNGSAEYVESWGGGDGESGIESVDMRWSVYQFDALVNPWETFDAFEVARSCGWDAEEAFENLIAPFLVDLPDDLRAVPKDSEIHRNLAHRASVWVDVGRYYGMGEIDPNEQTLNAREVACRYGEEPSFT